MDGILLIDKPKGWTSHDVVAKVRSTLKKEAGKKIKVGHTGTLDPMATGLLVLVTGSYTKRAGEFSKLDKVYEAALRLGQTSNTGDAEGEITPVSDTVPDKKAVREALEGFRGEIEQIPPAYSAVKVGGKRAYKLAREGKEVKIEPRRVKVYEITDINYDYPLVSFTVKVSSGTYIRSLAQDIGEKLSTGAYLAGLKRIQIGDFSIKKSVSPIEANIDKIVKI
ncbi:MAG TPA: tRNA pseudouridine(55) synthase TruB [Candidatus Saccharimonadales bacterium]|nr:tRNA pseudouridine(55) synthase TruB [Candidatus Saccharimonadales bacterium]